MPYYVCDVIGNGTESDPYRPDIADHGDFSVAALPSNADGTPSTVWALAVSPVQNAAGVRKLPSLPPEAADVAKTKLDEILATMGITSDISKPEYAGAVAMIDRDFG